MFSKIRPELFTSRRTHNTNLGKVQPKKFEELDDT